MTAALIAAAATSVVALAAPVAGAQRDISSCNPCSIGQTLSFHGTAYQVRSVRSASRIGDSYIGGHASGIFVIITLKLTELKSRPSTILASAVQIKAHGATFDQSDKAFAVYKNGFSILQSLNPHLPETVVAVYDLPRSYAHGAQLRIEDLGSGSYAYIRLGI
jgi:hypothetical protein